MAILSHLSQHEQVGEPVPCQEIQQALKREKNNPSKLIALQKLNEELLSVVEEQHLQLRAHVLPSSTESESKAEEQGRIRPKAEMCCFVKRSSFQYCARHSQCQKWSSSPNSQYVIRVWGGWHSERYGGPAATGTQHPNCR